MVKRCAWGHCNSDTRYPERMKDVRFFPFPKPKSKLEKCRLWIKLCGRPYSELNPSKINKHTYVCSKHFVNGKPSPEYPNPASAVCGDRPNVIRRRPRQTKRVRCDLKDISIATTGLLEDSTTEEDTMVTEMECTEEVRRLRTRLARKEKENDLLREKIETLQVSNKLTPEIVNNSSVPNYFYYCTGFTYDDFNKLCTFFRLPANETAPQTHIPLIYKKVDRQIQQMPLRQQFLLVLMKLRQNLDLEELAFKYQIDVQSVSTLFNSWMDLMYGMLGQLSIWPHRDNITENMPDKYKTDFPTTFAVLHCTELKIETPSSLLLQSQTYSNTLKSLLAFDPRGSIIFVSTLYTGSISGQEIFKQCKIKDLLKGLLQCGYLKKGDGLMADKGLLIEKDVEELGLKLNIPPFAKSKLQMPGPHVEVTKKKAKHQVHVERAIAKIKKFKIVSGRIPYSRLGNINQIWFVVCMLSNFQPHIIKVEAEETMH